jgi:hypothetical protein
VFELKTGRAGGESSYCPSIRAQLPITRQIPAISIRMLLQPQPIHGPRGPDG